MGLDIFIGDDEIRDFWKGGLDRGGKRFGFDIDSIEGKTGAEAAVILQGHFDNITRVWGLLMAAINAMNMLDAIVQVMMKKYPAFNIGLGNPVPDDDGADWLYHGRPLLPDDELRICLAWRLSILLKMSKDNPDDRWVLKL